MTIREAIERVIAELEERRKSYANDCEFLAISATEFAMDKLKEVLATETVKVRSEENNS